MTERALDTNGENQGAADAFGTTIRRHRQRLGLSVRRGAAMANISPSYLAQIESGVPPPRETAERILRALEFSNEQFYRLLGVAAQERGSTEADEQLPLEVRELIRDLRRYAYVLPSGFTRGLRTAVREAVR